jgi:hypothetical protein
MLFSKNNNRRSSRTRSRGKRISKKKMMHGGFIIRVSDLTGPAKNLDVKLSDSVAEVKNKVKDLFNISDEISLNSQFARHSLPNEVRWRTSVWGSEWELDDSKSLADYDFIKDNTLLYFRLKNPTYNDDKLEEL